MSNKMLTLKKNTFNTFHKNAQCNHLFGLRRNRVSFVSSKIDNAAWHAFISVQWNIETLHF